MPKATPPAGTVVTLRRSQALAANSLGLRQIAALKELKEVERESNLLAKEIAEDNNHEDDTCYDITDNRATVVNKPTPTPTPSPVTPPPDAPKPPRRRV